MSKLSFVGAKNTHGFRLRSLERRDLAVLCGSENKTPITDFVTPVVSSSAAGAVTFTSVQEYVVG